MNRLGVIDPDQLPVFAVLEKLDSEQIIRDRMTKLKEIWTEHDPPNGAVYDVEALEFDPLRITQEAESYYELLLRDRVNQAAKDVTLAYARGGSLDAIASRYPGGVPRLPVVANPRPYDEHPEDWENDDRYRRRIWLSPATLSPHGLEEAYVFWALSADATLKDASATTIEGTGHVSITLLASGADPRPTDVQLNAVRAYIADYGRKGFTDIVSVLPPAIVRTPYDIDYWLYSGPDAKVTEEGLRQSLAALIETENWLGADHTLMAINTACGKVAGVHNVHVNAPPQDIAVGPRGVVQVSSIDLHYKGRAA